MHIYLVYIDKETKSTAHETLQSFRLKTKRSGKRFWKSVLKLTSCNIADGVAHQLTDII